MKKLSLILLSALLLVVLFVPVEAHPPRVVDEAGVLSGSQLSQLTSKLDTISLNHNIDVVVYVIEELPYDMDAMDVADDFYDLNGYGLANNDGILLFVALDGYWHVSTCGKGQEYVTEYYIDKMADSFVPYLSDGFFYDAFVSFADDAETAFISAENGEIIERPFGFAGKGILAGGIGMVISLITTGSMKGKLKSVRSKDTANDYTRPGSMNITTSSDLFLYSQVSRTRRQTDSGRSGSSGSHYSSSGVSHGGHGGRF